MPPAEVPEWVVPTTIPSVTEYPSQLPPQQQTPQQEVDLSLGEGFLRAIPEQDRAIVAKYIKDWDGNVTREFQKLHEQYAPYKDLGDLEQIMQAVQVNQYLQSNPVEFYQLLQETIDEMREAGLIMPENEPVQPQTPIQTPAEPDPNSQILQELQELKEWRQSQEMSAQERQEQAQLDDLVKALHNEYGDFDEDWVLLQIGRNIPPAEAVKAWNSLIESKVSSFAKPKPPAVMAGNGSVPGSQVDLSKLTGAERIKFVADTLAAANQQ